MSTTVDKEFENKWNAFCKKVRFICCCGCDVQDHDGDPPLPTPIVINTDIDAGDSPRTKRYHLRLEEDLKRNDRYEQEWRNRTISSRDRFYR